MRSLSDQVRLYRVCIVSSSAEIFLRILPNWRSPKTDEAAKDIAEDNFEIEDLEIFENVAYIMALHADPKNTPKTIEEWLDDFEMFSIYEILPEILELWGSNLFTDVKARKN